MWREKEIGLREFHISVYIIATGQSQSGRQMLSQQKLVDLVSEVDPKQVLDEDVEEVRQITDNFNKSL